MLYDRLYNPKLWDGFFQPDSGFSLYAHATELFPSFVGFPERTVTYRNLVPSEQYFVLNLMRELLREALKNEQNKKFMFASGTCIPLKDASFVREKMEADDNSYVAFWDPPYIAPTRMVEELRPWYATHAQWVILNRKHAEMYANEDELFSKFNGVAFADEHFFGTMLKRNGIANDPDVVQDCFTGADWNYAENNGKSPRTVREIDAIAMDNLMVLAKRGCLFARKYLTLSDSDGCFVRDTLWSTQKETKP